MFARVTTYNADPQKLDEMASQIDGLKQQINKIAGVVDVYSAWRADGQGVTTAIYESQAAADAAATEIQSIWAGLGGYLTAVPEVTTYENVEHLTG